MKAKEAKPNDPNVYMQLAGYYNRQGDFPKTIEALDAARGLEPNNPEAHYTVSTYYWDKAYRDFRLKDAEKLDMVHEGHRVGRQGHRASRTTTWRPSPTRTSCSGCRPT